MSIALVATSKMNHFFIAFRNVSYRNLWNHIGINNLDFFSNPDMYNWLKQGAASSQVLSFLASVWWSWRHHNLMYLNNETWSLS
jgi:hypothetical protein